MAVIKADSQHFWDQVLNEIHLLQGRLPEWYPTGPYADHLRPLDPLERREAERLDRLLRRERAAWGERTRERAMREQASPWREEKRWMLRKRVWRERRDRERELLEQRERTLLERENELSQLRSHFERWLAQLRDLDPAALVWCAEQKQIAEDQGITPKLLDQLHSRRNLAAQRRARELLAREDVQHTLRSALRGEANDAVAIAKQLMLAQFGSTTTIPLDIQWMPIVLAWLALLIVSEGLEKLCGDDPPAANRG
jgi:hypothetical protein